MIIAIIITIIEMNNIEIAITITIIIVMTKIIIVRANSLLIIIINDWQKNEKDYPKWI